MHYFRYNIAKLSSILIIVCLFKYSLNYSLRAIKINSNKEYQYSKPHTYISSSNDHHQELNMFDMPRKEITQLQPDQIAPAKTMSK